MARVEGTGTQKKGKKRLKKKKKKGKRWKLHRIRKNGRGTEADG